MAIPFRVIDTGVRNGRTQIAFDQALIELHREGRVPDTVRFLRFEPSALVGRHQAIGQELKLDYCRANGVALVRRITGGGAIYLDPDQVEIVEDLLDIDPEHDLTDDAINGGFFPAAEIHKTGSFPLSELVGPRGQADGCPEWDWVCTHSGLTRHTAGDRRIAGFVLDLNRKLPEIPLRLRPMLGEARRKGLGYLIFY